MKRKMILLVVIILITFISSHYIYSSQFHLKGDLDSLEVALRRLVNEDVYVRDMLDYEDDRYAYFTYGHNHHGIAMFKAGLTNRYFLHKAEYFGVSRAGEVYQLDSQKMIVFGHDFYGLVDQLHIKNQEMSQIITTEGYYMVLVDHMSEPLTLKALKDDAVQSLSPYFVSHLDHHEFTEDVRLSGVYVVMSIGLLSSVLFLRKEGPSMKSLLKPILHIRRLSWRLRKPVSKGARALLIDEGEVLLVKHAYHEAWYLPGGKINKNEDYQEGLQRELFEELGVKDCRLDYFGTYHSVYEYKDDTILVFVSKNFTFENKVGFEIEKVKYFPLDQLPVKISPGTRKRIQEYLNHQVGIYDRW